VAQQRLLRPAPRPTVGLCLAVAAGGAIGAVLRYGLSEAVGDGSGFPWTTFAINVTGCFVLALLPPIAGVRDHQALAVALGPGLLGGFTTMSTYAEQARALLDDDRLALAGAYVGGTLLACLGAVALGRLISPREPRR